MYMPWTSAPLSLLSIKVFVTQATMKSSFLVLALSSLVLQLLAVVCASQDFDFFYFVQQWPASYCDTKKSCCYPTTGKPDADFGIHGLWPNYNNGSYPTDCNPNAPFKASSIADLKPKLQEEWPTLACPSNDGTKFWSHEWEKHGTCTTLDEHSYFEKSLKLKEEIDLLSILKNAGIEPNGSFYKLNSIIAAIKKATGFTAEIQCNKDESRNRQLYQVYMCVDKSASYFIECPILEKRGCPSSIEFPSFSSTTGFSEM